MSGVSTRALSVLIEALESREFDLDRLTAGLGVDLRALQSPRATLPWSTLAAILDRVSDAIGGPDAMRQLGREMVSSNNLRVFKNVGRAITHPRDLYSIGARWIGPSMFPMVEARNTTLSNDRLVQRLSLHPGHRDCPAFFHLMHGSLAAAPQAWGHGESDVTMSREPGVATYVIRTQSSSSGWLGRVFRALRSRVAFPNLIRELEDQQFAIDQNYREIREARDRIALQANDLERVNSIGRTLSEEIELDTLTDVLIHVMIDELDVAGVELWLIRSDTPPTSVDSETSQALPPELVQASDTEMASENAQASNAPGDQGPEMPGTNGARFFRQGGRTEGDPHERYLLETAARPVGTLHIWRDASAVRESNRDALLERLLPWIAIALDNARSYEALERHAADLEQRVKERTARLLSANHHLVREIEERQRATDALLHSEAQLRASERLASVGTLAAGIAHEINNPIGAILAASQLAQITHGDPAGEPQLPAVLSDIEAQAKRCGEIVRSVLQFSRDERTEKWDCLLNDVLRRSTRLVGTFAAEHGTDLRIDLPSESPWVHANPIQLEQAFVNLLRNAVEAGSTQVSIRVRVDSIAREVAVEISDNGTGIAAKDRMRILEPFYTTRRADGGTGLGLSVVHGIAVEHRGTLEIESIPSTAEADTAGAVVRFTIPIVAGPAEPLSDKQPEDPVS